MRRPLGVCTPQGSQLLSNVLETLYKLGDGYVRQEGFMVNDPAGGLCTGYLRFGGDTVNAGKLLDLFCGAGMASDGYVAAGFTTTGVDVEPQPHYPYEFVQADALDILNSDYPEEFDVIHTSPPCQAATTMSNRWKGHGGKADSHVNLIPDVIRLFKTKWAHKKWVIENVRGARQFMPGAVSLRGGTFGLRVDRTRLFLSNRHLVEPLNTSAVNAVGVYGKYHDGHLLYRRANGTEQRMASSLQEGLDAMGVRREIPWESLTEGFPPAYTKFIGDQLRDWETV